MKIIVLGAGQVGGSVAGILCNEGNDVTVVDIDASLLAVLRDRYDLRTVHGHAAHPNILGQAGARDADMVLAVTGVDEVNMVACQCAWTLFHTPTKVARIRSPEYLRNPELFATDALPIDLLISPEQEVTEYIERLIAYPGALQVLDFAGGRVQLVGVRAFHGGPLVSHPIRDFPEHLKGIEARVAAIFRRGEAVIPTPDTLIEPGDEVFFIAAPKHIRRVMTKLRRLDRPNRHIIIAGGGNIGLRLAEALEDDYEVKLIELDPERAEALAGELTRAIVLRGDAADEELLLSENIERTDVFCAVTNADAANIISAMLAKRLGAHTVMALVNRPAYADLVQQQSIDIAISPQQATIGSLLARIRRGDVVRVHSLRGGVGEAIEAVAHGDPRSSKVVGRTVDEVPLPPGTTIAAIARGDRVLMAHHDVVIEPDDHVILVVTDRRRVREVERLFQVGVTFL